MAMVFAPLQGGVPNISSEGISCDMFCSMVCLVPFGPPHPEEANRAHAGCNSELEDCSDLGPSLEIWGPGAKCKLGP